MLPQHGEEDLAERVLTITDAELERIGELGGYYAWSEEAFELLGGSMGGTRALCLATIDVLEGNMRTRWRRPSLNQPNGHHGPVRRMRALVGRVVRGRHSRG